MDPEEEEPGGRKREEHHQRGALQTRQSLFLGTPHSVEMPSRCYHVNKRDQGVSPQGFHDGGLLVVLSSSSVVVIVIFYGAVGLESLKGKA